MSIRTITSKIGFSKTKTWVTFTLFLLPFFFPWMLTPSPAHAEVPAPSTVQAATGKDAKGNPVPAQGSTEAFRPQLTIPIPNVSLSAIKTKSESGYIDVPWIAEYVSGAYKYAVDLAGLLATVMFMIGGFQYLTAGGDASRAGAGKKRITDAIVGMLLAFGAYTLLRTVNPGLVTTTDLRIKTVARIPFTPNLTIRPGVEMRGGPEADLKPGSVSSGAEPAVIDGFKKAAAETKVDGCVMITIGDHETGNALNMWNGKPSGTPREKGFALGPGQVDIQNLGRGKPFSKALEAKFPGVWPDSSVPDPQAKEKKKDLMLSNADISTYAAALVFRANGGTRGNELQALAGYAAGGGSVESWRKANGCRPGKLTMAQAANMKFEDAMKVLCLPTAKVAVPIKGQSTCPSDGGECRNAKSGKDATFRGTCQNGPEAGEPCVGMDTSGFIRYVLSRYNSAKAKYNCE